MRTRTTAIICACLLAAQPFISTCLAAQAGAIEGYVQRARDKQPVAGARVEIRETGASTTTASEGHYTLSGIAPGTYTVVITADGDEPVTRRATVAAGESASVDVQVEPVARAMASIVVEAQRTSEALARTAQKEAENLVYVLAADEMRKLPVVNSGDAVRGIPGVQLETDTGEGRFVNIRGLDSDLSSTTFGGVRLPPTDVTTSPYGGSRAVSFDAIPSEMIGALVVTKTNRPEQEAEALGGTVEISPKTVPQSGKPLFADLRVGTGTELLRHTGIKDFAATFGGRFALGDLGRTGGDAAQSDTPFSALGVFSYYEDRRGVDDLEEAYFDAQPVIPDKAQATWEQRYYRQHKKRHVYGAELGYAPSVANKWYLRYYDFGVVQDYNRNALLFTAPSPPPGGPGPGPSVLADGTFVQPGLTAQKIYRSNTETFDTRLAALGGSNDLDSVKLDYFIAHTLGSYVRPFDQIPVWTSTATPTIAYNNNNSNLPSFAVAPGTGNPYDVSAYTLSGFSNSTQRSITKDWSSKINAAIPTHLTSYATEELKFGLGARLRTFDQNQSVYQALTVPAIPLAQATFGPDLNYYDNHYRFGPLIGTGAVSNAFAQGTGFTNDPVADAANGARGTYNVKEDVYAGYGQYQFGFGKLGLFAGLRIEATRSTFNAFNVGTANQIEPISTRHSYTDYLPSLQARYEFSPTVLVRAIYSSTIGRPGYNQQSPALNINLPANLVSLGNPDIKPMHAHNIDLSIEDYLPHGGILSFGVFYKNLKDYIVPLRTNQTFPNSGLFAGFTGPVAIVSFENGPAARALGYEFDAERHFTELPGWLNGFGASFNWTGITSRIAINPTQRPGDYTQLPSTAKLTGNAALFYEREKVFDVRIGANYISRSLFAIGQTSALDIYSESRLSLDFGSRYFATDNVSVYLNIKNLTNTPLKYTEGTTVRPIQREFYRETVQFGVNATF